METNRYRRDDDALTALIEDDVQMDRLAREAVLDALRQHKERGESVVV